MHTGGADVWPHAAARAVLVPAGVLLDVLPVSAWLVPVLFWWTVRERAERQREHAELLSKLESSERRLQSRIGRVLSEEAYVSAHRCVFALSWTAADAAHGVGVLCGSPGFAVTAAHNLKAKPKTARVVGKVYPCVDDVAREPTLLELEVVHVDWDLDVATLRLLTPRAYPHFLECYAGPALGMTGGATLALCAFQLAIEEDLPEFSGGLGVMSATGVRLSPHARHLLYSCTTYAGDSGAALLMHDAQLVGIHLEFVNALRESLERTGSVDERLSSVEGSLADLVAGAGQGTSVALLASQFTQLDASPHERNGDAEPPG